jgi:hypothetical protein
MLSRVGLEKVSPLQYGPPPMITNPNCKVFVSRKGDVRALWWDRDSGMRDHRGLGISYYAEKMCGGGEIGLSLFGKFAMVGVDQPTETDLIHSQPCPLH